MAKENNDRGFIYVAALAIIVLGIVAFSAREASISGINGSLGKGSVITVGASGISYDLPSQATIYVALNGTGNSTAAATANVTKTLNAINNSIGGYINWNQTYVTTTGYSSYKVYNSSAYAVFENLVIVIPNIANVSSAISSISQVPNAYISSVQPMLSDQQLTTMRSVALWRALNNATVQAQLLAGPSASIRQTNITVNSYSVVPYPAYANSFIASAKSAGGSQSSPYYGGRSKLVESVSVVFTFQKGCGC
ncbi:MAG TPA: SIMPL domain-containing protein [Candidatus Acidoferrales bacterium]|nr:SIMPL domain-containing protein [Candidatus Acidoferrales bacterium]